MPTEEELDAALAQALVEDAGFASWLIEQTKFNGRSAKCISARSDNPWGKFPFEAVNPATGRSERTLIEGETDVLAIYQAADGELLGVHIENKLAKSRFRPLQAQAYPARAAHWAGNPDYGNYKSWETVLVAPKSFYERNAQASAAFGLFVAHEEIARFVTRFRQPV
jgi:hypothetical protein